MPSQRELLLLLAWGLGGWGKVQTSPRSQAHWGVSASRLWCSGDPGCGSQGSVLSRWQKQKALYIFPVYFKYDQGAVAYDYNPNY